MNTVDLNEKIIKCKGCGEIHTPGAICEHCGKCEDCCKCKDPENWEIPRGR